MKRVHPLAPVLLIGCRSQESPGTPSLQARNSRRFEPQTSNIFSRSLRLEYFNIHTSALFCPETGPIFADMAQEPATEKKPKSFEALTPELSSWILDFAQSSGFARTTPVQAMAIPLLMGNKDLVVEVSTVKCFQRCSADFVPGRHWQWQNPQLLDPYCGALTEGRRP